MARGVEIDLSTGSLWDDVDGAQNYRTETLDYVRLCLGLSYDRDWRSVKPSSPIIRGFEVIGKALRSAYDVEHRERFSQEMKVFVEMSEREQRVRLNGVLPSVEEFWGYRLGSSAVGVCLAALEFTYDDMQLPASIMHNADMELLWDQTNIIISTVNDLLSLKKEMACGSIQSLLPILYVKLGSIQAAVDQATKLLIASVRVFEEVAQRLVEPQGSSTAKSNPKIRAFIDGCRFYCTGNLSWR
ncbi:hypothetical protein MMC27_006147 [Xylographa pallens]|nr:hypothetical protein [Xylographa pallens]